MEAEAIAIKAVFCLLAGVANAGMDSLAHHYSISIFRFWDQDYWGPNSWQNKYHRPKWLPILLMDGWHLMKSIMLTSLFIGVAYPLEIEWYWNALGCRVLFSIGFNLPYKKFFIRK